jgi:hypothetical protein
MRAKADARPEVGDWLGFRLMEGMERASKEASLFRLRVHF